MLKIIGIAVGAMLAFCGLVAAGGGGAALATIGSDGKVSSGQQTFATSSSALVSSAADLRRPNEVSDIVGDPRVRLSVHATTPKSGVFVGVGPAAEVERYLASSAIDEVTDFEVNPFRMEHHPRGGSARPAPPGKQSFWVAKNSGADGATLDWKARSGEYRVVVMNADGSPGVRTQGDVSLTLPHTAPIAWSLLGGGLALLLAGVATIVLSARASAPSPRRIPAY